MADKFEIELPAFHLLEVMEKNHTLVKATVEKHGLMDWVNSYTQQCHFGLVELLCTPDGRAFVEKFWNAHQKGGTPFMVRVKTPKKGEEAELKPNDERIEFLKNTDLIVRDVAKAMEVPTSAMETELPNGEYLYLIEVRDSPVFKFGHVTIESKVRKDTGKPCGRRCVKDRYWSESKGKLKDAPARPVHFVGDWALERLTLKEVVPGTFADRVRS